jgi:hypothetical protein
MAVPTGGVDKCRQPVSPGVLHNHVQRSGMVSKAEFSKRSWRRPRRMRLETSILQNTC